METDSKARPGGSVGTWEENVNYGSSLCECWQQPMEVFYYHNEHNVTEERLALFRWGEEAKIIEGALAAGLVWEGTNSKRRKLQGIGAWVGKGTNSRCSEVVGCSSNGRFHTPPLSGECGQQCHVTKLSPEERRSLSRLPVLPHVPAVPSCQGLSDMVFMSGHFSVALGRHLKGLFKVRYRSFNY